MSEYTIANESLEEVSVIRDLGVLMDAHLRFTVHIDKTINDANKSLGFIIRSTKDFKNPHSVILLYNSYVRSKLEYCSTVWCPSYNVHIKRLERVQKKLLRSLSYRFRPPRNIKSYIDRLKHFGMESLSVRRTCMDMSFLHKVLNNHIDSPKLLKELNFNMPTRLPRHPCGLFKNKLYRTNLGRNSPLFRLSRLYNDLTKKLPELDINFQSLIKFIHTLKLNVPQLVM